MKKENNRGAISTSAIILIAIASVAVIGALWIAGINNNLVRQENGIFYAHENLKNIHTSVFNQIKSQGLSVEKYGEMVNKAMQVAVEGRYGKTGSQAAMQWIQEQNPTIDPSVIGKLQVAIEAGYNEFKAAQTDKLDRLKTYDSTLESTFSGFVARNILHFPRKVTADMRKTISSAETEKMMETKQMETIDPFSPKPSAK